MKEGLELEQEPIVAYESPAAVPVLETTLAFKYYEGETLTAL